MSLYVREKPQDDSFCHFCNRPAPIQIADAAVGHFNRLLYLCADHAAQLKAALPKTVPEDHEAAARRLTELLPAEVRLLHVLGSPDERLPHALRAQRILEELTAHLEALKGADNG